MAKAPPSFDFYPNDFLGGTSHLTADEVGAYLRLLCHQWANGCVPNDADRLMAICGVTENTTWERIWDHIRDKFDEVKTSRLSENNLEVFGTCRNGSVFVNLRMSLDRKKKIESWRKRIAGGKLGGRPKAKTSRFPKNNLEVSRVRAPVSCFSSSSLNSSSKKRNQKKPLDAEPELERLPESLRQIVREWIQFKADQFSDRYTEIGFKRFVSHMLKRLEGLGESEIIHRIETAMRKPWRDWDYESGGTKKSQKAWFDD